MAKNTNCRFDSPTIIREYIIFMKDESLKIFLDDITLRSIGFKTNCSIVLTNRILNRKLNAFKTVKYAIVRIVGVDECAIRQCNRLLEQQFPPYRHRKEYQKRTQCCTIYPQEFTPDNTELVYPFQRTGCTSTEYGEVLIKSPYDISLIRPKEVTFWKSGDMDLKKAKIVCHQKQNEKYLSEHFQKVEDQNYKSKFDLEKYFDELNEENQSHLLDINMNKSKKSKYKDYFLKKEIYLLDYESEKSICSEDISYGRKGRKITKKAIEKIFNIICKELMDVGLLNTEIDSLLAEAIKILENKMTEDALKAIIYIVTEELINLCMEFNVNNILQNYSEKVEEIKVDESYNAILREITKSLMDNNIDSITDLKQEQYVKRFNKILEKSLKDLQVNIVIDLIDDILNDILTNFFNLIDTEKELNNLTSAQILIFDRLKRSVNKIMHKTFDGLINDSIDTHLSSILKNTEEKAVNLKSLEVYKRIEETIIGELMIGPDLCQEMEHVLAKEKELVNSAINNLMNMLTSNLVKDVLDPFAEKIEKNFHTDNFVDLAFGKIQHGIALEMITQSCDIIVNEKLKIQEKCKDALEKIEKIIVLELLESQVSKNPDIEINLLSNIPYRSILNVIVNEMLNNAMEPFTKEIGYNQVKTIEAYKKISNIIVKELLDSTLDIYANKLLEVSNKSFDCYKQILDIILKELMEIYINKFSEKIGNINEKTNSTFKNILSSTVNDLMDNSIDYYTDQIYKVQNKNLDAYEKILEVIISEILDIISENFIKKIINSNSKVMDCVDKIKEIIINEIINGFVQDLTVNALQEHIKLNEALNEISNLIFNDLVNNKTEMYTNVIEKNTNMINKACEILMKDIKNDLLNKSKEIVGDEITLKAMNKPKEPITKSEFRNVLDRNIKMQKETERKILGSEKIKKIIYKSSGLEKKDVEETKPSEKVMNEMSHVPTHQNHQSKNQSNININNTINLNQIIFDVDFYITNNNINSNKLCFELTKSSSNLTTNSDVIEVDLDCFNYEYLNKRNIPKYLTFIEIDKSSRSNSSDILKFSYCSSIFENFEIVKDILTNSLEYIQQETDKVVKYHLVSEKITPLECLECFVVNDNDISSEEIITHETEGERNFLLVPFKNDEILIKYSDQFCSSRDNTIIGSYYENLTKKSRSLIRADTLTFDNEIPGEIDQEFYESNYRIFSSNSFDSGDQETAQDISKSIQQKFDGCNETICMIQQFSKPKLRKALLNITRDTKFKPFNHDNYKCKISQHFNCDNEVVHLKDQKLDNSENTRYLTDSLQTHTNTKSRNRTISEKIKSKAKNFFGKIWSERKSFSSNCHPIKHKETMDTEASSIFCHKRSTSLTESIA